MRIQKWMMSFKANEELYQAFETYATQLSANRSELLRKALRLFLEDRGVLKDSPNKMEIGGNYGKGSGKQTE